MGNISSDPELKNTEHVRTVIENENKYENDTPVTLKIISHGNIWIFYQLSEYLPCFRIKSNIELIWIFWGCH